jgi:hypothetical protein
MKTVLSLVLLFSFVCVANAQPPRDGRGKFGMGQGQFGDFSKMAEMRNKDVPELPKLGPPSWAGRGKQDGSGPPPWAGQGMRRGPRGPQCPFLDRGTDPKGKISIDNIDNRGQRRKFDNTSNETKGRGAKGKKSGGYNKGGKVVVIIIN